MTMDLYDEIGIFLHYIAGVIGISASVFLLFLILKYTPPSLRTYAVLLFNSAFTDALACFMALFVMQRILPCHHSLMYISYGWCTAYGHTACYVGYCFLLHLYAHALYSMPLSFAYRYYILIRPSPPTKWIVLACVIIYIPSLFQAITFIPANDNPIAVEKQMNICFPEYEVHETIMTGHVNVFNFWAMFTILYMTLPCFPIYLVVLYFRRKVYNCLDQTDMSPETKHTHNQLMKALTLQACLPAFFNIAIAAYAVEQFDIFHHPLLEHLVFQTFGLMPMFSPLLTIYFVAPYRRACIRIFKKLTGTYTKKKPQSPAAWSSKIQPATESTCKMTIY